MGLFLGKSEEIRTDSLDQFLANLREEGAQSVTANVTLKEVPLFPRTYSNFPFWLGGSFGFRFFKVGARFESLSISGLPIVYEEVYETIDRTEEGYAFPNPDDVAARAFLTIDRRLHQIREAYPRISVIFRDGNGELPYSKTEEFKRYATELGLRPFANPLLRSEFSY